jgi:hypothetical protein
MRRRTTRREDSHADLNGLGSALRGGDVRRGVDGYAARRAVPGHERRAGDDEGEGDEAGADLERARSDRFVEDEDAADEGGEVGRQWIRARLPTVCPDRDLRSCGPCLVPSGRADRRLALAVLGVLAGPSEALDELCGEVGVVQLHGCQAFSQEDRGLASVCGVCHDHDAGH